MVALYAVAAAVRANRLLMASTSCYTNLPSSSLQLFRKFDPRQNTLFLRKVFGGSNLREQMASWIAALLRGWSPPA